MLPIFVLSRLCSIRSQMVNPRLLVVRMVLLLSVFCFCAPTAKATWTHVAQFPARVTCGYFWDEFNGMVCVSGNTSTAAIERTTDGGVTWQAAMIPFWITNGGILMTDIWFANKLNGYCTFIFESTGANMWQTVDGGLSWSNCNFQGSPCSVRKTNEALIVTQYTGPGITISTDNGASWSVKVAVGLDGLSFSDDLHGTASGFGSPLYYTSDGGLSWYSANANIVEESWGVYAEPFTSKLFSVPENNYLNSTSPVYKSVDFGQTWQYVQTVLFKPAGDIQGYGNTLYVQNSGAFGGASGVFSSTDDGFTWVSLGGPNTSQFDVRMVVTGCGSVLYAFDGNGGVFKLGTHHDGAPINTCIYPTDTLKSMSTGLCDSLKQLFYFHNHGVDSVAVLDVRIADLTRAPAVSKAIHFDSIPKPDRYLGSLDSMGFSLGWVPIRFLHGAATDSTKIRVITYDLIYGSFDTFYYPLKLIALAARPQFSLLPTQLHLGPFAQCSIIDTVFQLFNHGCDTLTIVNGRLFRGSDWQITDLQGNPLALPIHLSSGGARSFRLRYTARDSAGATDSIRLSLSQLGIDTNVSIPITGSTKFSEPVLASRSIAFDSVSTCGSVDSFWRSINRGCDTAWITSIEVTGDWNMRDLGGNAITLPYALPQGDTLLSRIHFAPTTLGTKSGSITIHYIYFGVDTSFILSLTGTGKSTGSFDHLSSIDFGVVSECNPADTLVVFHNSTCGSITLDSLWIDAPFSTTALTSPIVLEKDSSLIVHLRYAVQKRGHAQGALYLREKIDGVVKVDTIAMNASVVSGSSNLVFRPSLDSLNFVTRSECGTNDSIVFYCQNTGCDTLSLVSAMIEGNCSAITTNAISPRALLDSYSERIAVHLSCVEGNYHGDLKIHFALADGSVRDSLLSINAIVTKGSRLLVLDTTAIDLGTFAACSRRDTAIVYSNQGCAPLKIRARTLAGGAIVSSDPLSDSTLLASGQSDTLHVSYDGSHTGLCTTTFTIHSDADIDSVRVIRLSINVVPVDTLRLNVILSSMSAEAGEVVTAGVFPERVVAGKSLQTVSGVLTFSNDAFDIISRTNEAGAAITWGAAVSVGSLMRIPFTISSAGELPLDPAVALVSLKLKVLLTDSSSVRVFVDSLSFNPSIPNYSNCVLASQSNPGFFTLALNACGDRTIQNTLGHQPLFSMSPVTPDPVSGASAKIEIHSTVDGTLNITLRDQLGRTIQAQQILTRSGSNTPIIFDLHNVPSGSYYYSVDLNSMLSKARESQQGSLFIVR